MGVVLQVGHQERFLFDRVAPPTSAHGPSEIVCRRAGPASGRAADCSVVLDLMIHDLDLVHCLVAGEAERATATAPQPPGPPQDVAEVQLKLNGCMVRLSASRINPTRERWIRVNNGTDRFEIDFVSRRVSHGALGAAPRPTEFPADDLLRMEIEDFLAAIRTGSKPRVTGEDGRRALATALLIDRSLGLGGA
jgi:predicted dehydrogenase